jgi:hypothetical protein
MAHFVRVLILSLTVAASASANSQTRATVLFLSAAEFQRLSPEQRHQYIEGLQKIMVAVNDRSEYFASTEKISSERAPASVATPVSVAAPTVEARSVTPTATSPTSEVLDLVNQKIQEARSLMKKADSEKNPDLKFKDLKDAAFTAGNSRIGMTYIPDSKIRNATYDEWKKVMDDLETREKKPNDRRHENNDCQCRSLCARAQPCSNNG